METIYFFGFLCLVGLVLVLWALFFDRPKHHHHK